MMLEWNDDDDDVDGRRDGVKSTSERLKYIAGGAKVALDTL